MKEQKMTKSKKGPKKSKKDDVVQVATPPTALVNNSTPKNRTLSPVDIILKLESIIKRIEEIELKLNIKK